MGMDLLSRQLQFLSDVGRLTGIRVTRSAPPLTNYLYADDLLLFGEASDSEAIVFSQTLNLFSTVSGQQVEPSKSSIWFSMFTHNLVRQNIEVIFHIPAQQASQQYLGAPIGTNSAAYEFLIEKFSSKLQAWKARLLSQSGRVVLIKSVLQSLPIYYMATSKISNGVIQKINSLIMKFFWGKMDQPRCMAYMAWEKICRPIGEGGLGFKDLKVVNDAMLTKFLRRLAANTKAQWVQFVRAKYLPRTRLWTSKRTYDCTGFWRSLMELRETLLPELRWVLGDGSTCEIVGEPWCKASMNVQLRRGMRDLTKVRDLVDRDSGMWDCSKIMSSLGIVACIEILSSLKPPCDVDGSDELIYNLTSNGNYSVKSGYNRLAKSNQVEDREQRKFWDLIWHKGDVLPRIRVFMWKLSRGALPLAAILAARISAVDPRCANYGTVNEDVPHLLFNCPLARGCWFASPMAIRTDSLWSNLQSGPQFLTEQLTDEQWTPFANISWSIWRCRNDKAYGGKEPQITTFNMYLSLITTETKIAASKRYLSRVPTVQEEQPQAQFECFTDGSWVKDWREGIGLVILKEGILLLHKSRAVQACCPLQAEALALREGIQEAMRIGLTGCSFFTDSKELWGLVTQMHPPLDTDWRSYKEIHEIWLILQCNQDLKCFYVQRSHTEVADYLARKGRIEGWDSAGFTFPLYQDFGLTQ